MGLLKIFVSMLFGYIFDSKWDSVPMMEEPKENGS